MDAALPGIFKTVSDEGRVGPIKGSVQILLSFSTSSAACSERVADGLGSIVFFNPMSTAKKSYGVYPLAYDQQICLAINAIILL